MICSHGPAPFIRLALKNGWFGDTSRMCFVGTPSVLARRLMQTKCEAMLVGIRQVKPGATLGDVWPCHRVGRSSGAPAWCARCRRLQCGGPDGAARKKPGAAKGTCGQGGKTANHHKNRFKNCCKSCRERNSETRCKAGVGMVRRDVGACAISASRFCLACTGPVWRDTSRSRH